MSSSDSSHPARPARRARPRLSLKMQAIGFLSRREHSRQELRLKLLDALRKRAREEAALAAAAEDVARTLREQPSNGIDDAFAPPMPAPPMSSSQTRSSGRGSGRLARPGAPSAAAGAMPASSTTRSMDDGTSCTAATSSRAVLDALSLASGAPLPHPLKARIGAAANAAQGEDDDVAATRGSSAEHPPGAERRPTTPVRLHQAESPSPRPAVDAAPDDDLEQTDPQAAVERLLDWLEAHGYLSDVRFVESRVNARSRKQGVLRIKAELSRHGVALDAGHLAALRESEFSRAQALWQRKFGEVAADPRQRAKQARFLAARGFTGSVVRRIVGGEVED